MEIYDAERQPTREQVAQQMEIISLVGRGLAAALDRMSTECAGAITEKDLIGLVMAVRNGQARIDSLLESISRGGLDLIVDEFAERGTAELAKRLNAARN